MPILRSLLEKRQIQGPLPLTSAAILDWLGGTAVHSGAQVNERTALTVTAVYRAVALIAGTAAALPLKVYRDRDGGREEIRTILLEAPYPDVSPFCFWELVFTHLLLWGNAYVFKTPNELGGIVRLLILPPSEVQVERQEVTPANPSGKVFRIAGNSELFTPAEIMHVPGLGHDGLRGLSPIGLARQAIGVALSAEEAAARLYSTGMMLRGVLQADQAITGDDAKTIAERFKEAVAGAANAGKVAVLDHGLKFEPITMPAEDAQFLESRQFEVSEIARLYGVPLHLLAESAASSNWGTGVEIHGRQFVTYTLMPWLKRVEQVVGMHLLPRGQFAEFLVEGLLRPVTTERFTAYRTAIDAGFLLVNEVRALENRPPLEEKPEPEPEPEPVAAMAEGSEGDSKESDEEPRSLQPITVNVTMPAAGGRVVRTVERDEAGMVTRIVDEEPDVASQER